MQVKHVAESLAHSWCTVHVPPSQKYWDQLLCKWALGLWFRGRSVRVGIILELVKSVWERERFLPRESLESLWCEGNLGTRIRLIGPNSSLPPGICLKFDFFIDINSIHWHYLTLTHLLTEMICRLSTDQLLFHWEIKILVKLYCSLFSEQIHGGRQWIAQVCST